MPKRNVVGAVVECPTCESSDKKVRKLVHLPGSGESDLAPVALWDRCRDPWHDVVEAQPACDWPTTQDTLEDKQERLVKWGTECFGAEHMSDSRVRAVRLLEEAIEFSQAVGVPQSQCSALVEYVYKQPVGNPVQELGGIGVTWLVAAAALGELAEDALDNEIERISKKPPSHFAARNQQKLNAGFTGEISK